MTLSNLASVLGVNVGEANGAITIGVTYDTNVNANNVKEGLCIYLVGGTDLINRGFPVDSYGVFVSFRKSDYYIQLYQQSNGRSLYCRSRWNTTVYSWKIITIS